jgi:outer membrane lipoprotein LolB
MMPPARLLIATIVALTTVIANGCAVQPPAAALAAARPLVGAFEMQGRLSATDGTRAAHGQINWNHGPTRDEWVALSPLGQIVARLVATPAGARLQTADGRVLEAPDAASILPQLLGVAAPIDGLKHWVQASLRDGARTLELDSVGRPQRISDAGWIIDYPEYDGAHPNARPRRIDATQGETRIRLIIDTWTPLP